MQLDLAVLDIPDDPLRSDIDDLGIMELAQSMAQLGQLQAIGVIARDDAPDRFRVLYGHRRTLAAQSLGWTTIEAYVVADNSQRYAKRLVENTQRAQLTEVEEAMALSQLMKEGDYNDQAAATLTGKTRAWVRSRLSILDWPEELQSALHEGLISQGVARHLATITHDQLREQYLELAITNGVTTEQAAFYAQTARYAATGLGPPPTNDDGTPANVPEPQVVDQAYNCFTCGERHSWRNVNTLVVCKACQQAIADSRLASQ